MDSETFSLDEFKLEALKMFLHYFDVFGHKTIHKFEEMYFLKLIEINNHYELVHRNKKKNLENNSERKLIDIFEIIINLSKSIRNKKMVKQLISKRVKEYYFLQKIDNKVKEIIENKKIINMKILLSENLNTRPYFISQVVRFFSNDLEQSATKKKIENNIDDSENEDEDEDDLVENQIKIIKKRVEKQSYSNFKNFKVIKVFENSKNLNYDMYKKMGDFKKNIQKEFKNKFIEEIEEGKKIMKIKENILDKIFSMDKKRIKFLKHRPFKVSDNQSEKINDSKKKMKKIKEKTVFELINIYYRTFKNKDSIQNLDETELDHLINILVEIKRRFNNLLNIELRGTSQEFSKLICDEGLSNMNIFILIDNLSKKKSNQFFKQNK